MIQKNKSLSEKIILITGAANGLGRSIALECGKAGASLILCDKELRNLEIVREELESCSNKNILLVPINFEGATIGDYEALVSAAKDRYGKLDCMIFNAATLGELAPLEHYDPMVWAKVFQVNLHSIFLMLKFCGPILEKNTNCDIIFTLAPEIRSIKPFWGAYAVSKKALLGLMELTTKEMASHSLVKVIGIVPSAMRTNLYRQAYPAGNYSVIDEPEKNVATYINILNGSFNYKSGDVIELGKKVKI